MKNGLEKDCEGTPQDTVDATTGNATREASGSPTGEGRNKREGEGQASLSGQTDVSPEQREEIICECRRTCRRHFWTELIKTIAKIAGVILAAFGVSSFNQED